MTTTAQDGGNGGRMIKGSRQIRYLGQSVQLEEVGMSLYVRLAMIMISVVVVGFIAWTFVTPVDEVSSALGQVVPKGSVRVVQHLEGGIIEQINVQEGDRVVAGELLVKMAKDAAQSELETVQARYAALTFQAERLRAFAGDRDPDFRTAADKVQGFADKAVMKDLIDDQADIYLTQINTMRTSEEILRRQVAQKDEEISILRKEEIALREQLALVDEELVMREELVSRGLTSRVTYLDTKRAAASIKGDIARVLGRQAAVQEEKNELFTRQLDLDNTLKQDALREMGTVTSELAQVRESLLKLRDRFERLEVVAPVSGTVQDIKVKTIGAVIPAGGIVLNVVPDEALRVEAQISTRDIGHVSIGQPVDVKVSAYDFARYGSVGGTLAEISATTFVDENEDPYYRGIVELDQLYVGNNEDTNRILAGMTVQADVVTGEKKLIEYLLKPIERAAEQAFTER
ncbi:MAG: HlyD family type I secretion periplasmic adaptor subunit [Rhodospirillaceae bacterium]